MGSSSGYPTGVWSGGEEGLRRVYNSYEGPTDQGRERDGAAALHAQVEDPPGDGDAGGRRLRGQPDPRRRPAAGGRRRAVRGGPRLERDARHPAAYLRDGGRGRLRRG